MIDSPTLLAPTPVGARAWANSFFGMPGILICAAFGLLLGVVVQQNEPSETTVTWIGTVGDLFLRAVSCLVAPLVFCSLVESLLDLFEDGRAARVSSFALLLYAGITVVATCEGLVVALLFRPLFSTIDLDTATADRVAVQLACSRDDNQLLYQFVNGSVACMSDTANVTVLEVDSSAAVPWTFWAVDVNDTLAKTTSSSSSAVGTVDVTASTIDQSLTDTLQTQLHSLVPSSLAEAFVNGDLLSIVTFSVLFTIALAAPGHRPLENLAAVLRDLNAALMRMITWVVRFATPFAILSLLAAAIGDTPSLSALVRNAGLYVVGDICVLVVHTYVFYPLLLFTVGRTAQPFRWLFSMARAQFFALGCASSMATLPVVMATVEETKVMPVTLSRFLLSVGATVGKDGAAASYPVAVLFLASAQGLHLSPAQIASVGLLSAIGSVATGPVPAAGVIMIAAIWRSVTGSAPPLELFRLLVGTDWLLDRLQTVVNVTCDTVVCRIIASHITIPAMGVPAPLESPSVDGESRRTGRWEDYMRQGSTRSDIESNGFYREGGGANTPKEKGRNAAELLQSL